ncbi:protein spinster homolog 1-like [Dendrobates tinctorius]|uniref:protein spinster homolog 1-like n=1 Tax=Dendrobates tinctorius TaxID=92724 RepID=UPI003CC9A252
MIGLLFMCVIVKEPTRGAAEGNNGKPLSSRAWISDVKNLIKNRSFMFCTLGMTAVKFAAGAISSYGPIFLHRAQGIIEESAQNQTEVSRDYDSLIFGLISCISGSLGVVTGVKIAKIYRKNNPRADPIVCASGLFGCAVFLVLALFMGDISIVATYVFMSIGIMCLNLNCSVSADIRQYVVSPARRSTAQAIFMIVSEPGTAGSSYVIKLISNAIKSHNPDSPFWEIHSLQYALLMVCPVVVAIGGGFFFACACFIEKDRKTAETESEDWLLKEVIVETP